MKLNKLCFFIFGTNQIAHEKKSDNDTDEHGPSHDHAQHALAPEGFVSQDFESFDSEDRGSALHGGSHRMKNQFFSELTLNTLALNVKTKS